MNSPEYLATSHAQQLRQATKGHQWAPWKDRIRTMLLHEDRALKDILEYLNAAGFEVSKAQLEYQLKQWKFVQNLPANVWRYVENIIGNRSAEGKKTLVILSGRRLPEEKVGRHMKRNQLVTWQPVENPNSVPENLPLYLCTPRGSSTNISRDILWPVSLPWIQFCRSHLSKILQHINFSPAPRKTSLAAIAGSEPSASLSQLARNNLTTLSKSQQLQLLPTVARKLAQTSLIIIIGSEEMATQLLASQSIDRIAALFDFVIPEIYSGENLQRVNTFFGSSQSEVQIEVLKILLYLASNHLLVQERTSIIEESQLIIGICRLSGLAQPHMLRNLIDISRSSLTMTAVIDTLFEAAVFAEAADIVSVLLKEQVRNSPDRGISMFYVTCFAAPWWYRWSSGSITPIFFAVVRGSVDLVSALLDAGANIHQKFGKLTLMAIAIFALSSSQSRKIVQVLLQKGANINVSRDGLMISAINAAIIMGDVNLIDMLLGHGADLTIRTAFTDMSAGRRLITVDRFCMPIYLDDIGCLGFAASFAFQLGDDHSVPCDAVSRFMKDQEKALGLCRKILNEGDSPNDIANLTTKDAIILAAAQGYTEVVSLFLHNQVSDSLDSTSGSLSPIYAAIGCKQVDTCRMLLQLGASPHTNKNISVETGWSKVPAPLQIAVACGSLEITELLIRHGADISKPSEVLSRGSHIFIGWAPLTHNYCHYRLDMRTIPKAYTEESSETEGTLAWLHWKYGMEGGCTEEVSILRLAILCEHYDTAILLLKFGATATPGDLFTAAVDGHFGLVKQLVDIGINPDVAVKNGLTAYQAAARHCHWQVSSYLVAVTAATEISASIRYLPDITQIQILLLPQLRNATVLERESHSRSWLEVSILSGNEEVVSYALSLADSNYDSGALCAAVIMCLRTDLSYVDPVITELLHRRNRSLDSFGIDPKLENTAVSLAAWGRRLDIVSQLSANRPSFWTQHPAVIPVNPSANNEIPPEAVLAWDMSTDAIYWHSTPFIEASPLLFAIQSRDERNKQARKSEVLRDKILKLLLAAGFGVDGYVLRAAICCGLSVHMIDRLAKECSDIDAERAISEDVEEIWATPLHCAVQGGCIGAVKTLLDHGADVNAVRRTFSFSSNALHEAIDRSHKLIFELLLSRGADPNQSAWLIGDGEKSPLAAAAKRGYIGILRQLLVYGANINSRRMLYQQTALEAAAAWGRIDSVQLLLHWGTHTEGYGRVQYVQAIQYATERGYVAVAELLRSHRQWTREDDAIWERLDYNNTMGRRDLVIHPEEWSRGELVTLIAELRTEEFSVGRHQPERGENWRRGVAIEIQEWTTTIITAKPAISKVDTLDDAIRIATWALEEYDPGTSLDWFDHGDHIAPHAREVVSQALREWAFSLESTDSLSTPKILANEMELSECESEDMNEGIQNGSCCVNNGSPDEDGLAINHDGQVDKPTSSPKLPLETLPESFTEDTYMEGLDMIKRDLFLRDMLGEEEAPFIPIDWQW